MPFTFRELVVMLEGKLETEWDLSNNVMAAVLNSAQQIANQLVACHGGKPKPKKPIDFTKLNPYRR